jgi:hypothetical protein
MVLRGCSMGIVETNWESSEPVFGLGLSDEVYENIYVL